MTYVFVDVYHEKLCIIPIDVMYAVVERYDTHCFGAFLLRVAFFIHSKNNKYRRSITRFDLKQYAPDSLFHEQCNRTKIILWTGLLN